MDIFKDTYGEIVTGIIVVIGVIFWSIKEIVKAYANRLVKRISGVEPEIPQNHQIFKMIAAKQIAIPYIEYSTTPFNNEILKVCESVFWEEVRQVAIGMAEGNNNSVCKLKRIVYKLEDSGIPANTLKIFGGTTTHVLLFLASVLTNILKSDKIFPDRNTQINMALSVLYDYCQTAHNASTRIIKKDLNEI